MGGFDAGEEGIDFGEQCCVEIQPDERMKGKPARSCPVAGTCNACPELGFGERLDPAGFQFGFATGGFFEGIARNYDGGDTAGKFACELQPRALRKIQGQAWDFAC